MKKIIYFLSVLLLASSATQAQDILTAGQKPKYLPENKASSLVKFTVDRENDMEVIDIASLKDVKNFTFYILKGINYDNGATKWQIIDSFQNAEQSTFHKKVTDRILNQDPVMNRLMIVAPNKQIEYTPILCLSDYNA